MKNIAILGSTGSIGVNTLDVISRHPEEFSAVGLTAYDNVSLLSKQVNKFSPHYAAVREDKITELQKYTDGHTKIFGMDKGIEDIISSTGVDLVVIAVSGSAALKPLLSAIKHSKTIALANKEALVMAGHIIMRQAKKYNAKIIPVDSEQSAIFQCLEGRDKRDLKKIYLTASGGPFKSLSKEKLKDVSHEQVLAHPRWSMGKKITVDSATLMNKGLELIEAMWLFDVSVKDIEILIHKEAIIHSMVEFIDGSILAQLGPTDMRLPIQFALSYPNRLISPVHSLDFPKLKKLSFEPPDFKKFPCLKLAYEAARLGGSAPCVLNAANEVSVSAFLSCRIKYAEIYGVIKRVISKHKTIKDPSLDEIISVDGWSRRQAERWIYN